MHTIRESRPYAANRGFSLIELLVVIVILTILLGIAIAGFRTFSIQPGRDASARIIVSTLDEARARSISADDDTVYGVHVATTTVTLFVGTTYSTSSATNDVRTLSRADVTAINLSDGSSIVTFSKLRGTASATGTLEITSALDTIATRTVQIYETGLAEFF